MRPVVVFTVHRRYLELERALRRLRELAGEFAEPPEAVVVWSQPELTRLWFFRKLREEGLYTSLLTRPRVPGEGDGMATTVPESVSIRLGLEFAAEHFPDGYLVLQAADVYPRDGAYAFVDAHMQAGAATVVFHWPNGCVPVNIWHTNFFAVGRDCTCWPPVAAPGEQDTLEWAWGKKLMRERPPGVVESHNHGERRFVHAHLSENNPPWPVWPEAEGLSFPLTLSGHLPWYARLWRWFRGVLPW